MFVSRILSANCQGTTKIGYLYLGARHIPWIKIGQTGTLRHIATYRDTLHISHGTSLRAAHFTAKRLAQRRRAKDCCTLNPGASPIMEDMIDMKALGVNKYGCKGQKQTKCHLLVHHVVYKFASVLANTHYTLENL